MNWKDNYPTRESIPDVLGNGRPWPFLGYLSQMVHLAITRDDPVGFVGWMRESGLDRNAKTFMDTSMETYCKRYGAEKCLAALSELS